MVYWLFLGLGVMPMGWLRFMKPKSSSTLAYFESMLLSTLVLLSISPCVWASCAIAFNIMA